MILYLLFAPGVEGQERYLNKIGSKHLKTQGPSLLRLATMTRNETPDEAVWLK